MPRGPRLLPESGMFHLIGRGNNGVRLFRHPLDFRRFKRILITFFPPSVCAIQHYALMPTHFHILAWVEDTRHLAAGMKACCVSYHHSYRRRYPYRGHLWHGRFRSILIEQEEHWLQCARYIELNPVHAGLCCMPDDYPWTSYHFHARGGDDFLLHIARPMPGMPTWQRGVENRSYQEFVRAGVDIDYQRLKKQFERERFDFSRGYTSRNVP